MPGGASRAATFGLGPHKAKPARNLPSGVACLVLAPKLLSSYTTALPHLLCWRGVIYVWDEYPA